jgi:hypothetical protein
MSVFIWALFIIRSHDGALFFSPSAFDGKFRNHHEIQKGLFLKKRKKGGRKKTPRLVLPHGKSS